MSFEWPVFLWGLLLVPVLAAAYVIAQRQRKTYAVRFTNLALLAQVAGPSPGFRRHIPALLFLVGFTALVVAVARPVAVVTLPRNPSIIMLVMDTSYSMEADDLKPSRIVAAQNAATQFVNQLPPATRVGLVSFNEKAYLDQELTVVHGAVVNAIENLKLDNNTAIGDGLLLALNQIARQSSAVSMSAPSRSAIVILLSDGVSLTGTAPLVAAERAIEMGVEVNTVGIGQRGENAQIRSDVKVGLDESTLRAMATQTGGEYFYAAQSDDLNAVYQELSTKVSSVREPTEVTAIAAGIGTFLFLMSGLLNMFWFQRFP